MVSVYEGDSQAAAQFRHMLGILVERARAAGLAVAPPVEVQDLDAAVRVAAQKAGRRGAGEASVYSVALDISAGSKSRDDYASYERVGQMWESLGGTWGGRISPDARGLFVWRDGGR